jgi:D-serine deaminase-like pyridoxal phosphate-dependent protein
MSHPAADRAIVDAGLKALAFDSGQSPPEARFIDALGQYLTHSVH